jgi:hypothetical protein
MPRAAPRNQMPYMHRRRGPWIVNPAGSLKTPKYFSNSGQGTRFKRWLG